MGVEPGIECWGKHHSDHQGTTSRPLHGPAFNGGSFSVISGGSGRLNASSAAIVESHDREERRIARQCSAS